MAPALRAGAAYFGVVFAVGFVLGAARGALLLPRLGELGAVAVELPLILGASWAVCGWIVRRFRVEPGRPRWAMGAFGFGLLILAELALAEVLGRGARDWIAGLATPAGALGLAGQVAFALFPALRGGEERTA